MPLLEIKNLRASIEGREILKGVNLSIPAGEIHAIMGPNGSGKSTLSYVLMGHSRYTITEGEVLLDGTSILGMTPDERARRGMFLCFQYPTSIPGVTMPNYLRTVLKNVRGAEVPMKEFRKELQESMASLAMREDFLKRYVNDGFSGGEKKRNEILQMALMKPRIAILDEVDSGLDIDALRVIAENLQAMRSPERSMLLITHYQRILNYLTLDRVHVFAEGRIILSGGRDLAERLEKEGYEAVIKANR